MVDDVQSGDEQLALCLRALGHPVRLAILRALAQADRCQCGEIVRGLTLAQSTVSQHLKVLKEAGLIRGEIEGPRSCYCLDRVAVSRLAGTLGSLLGELAVQPAASADAALADACQPRTGLKAPPATPISEPTLSPATPSLRAARARSAQPAGVGTDQSTDRP